MSKKRDSHATHDIDFNYIIKRRTFAPIAFGSKAERITMPLEGKGLSPFMRKTNIALYPKISPATYANEVKSALYPLSHKPWSTKGLVRNEARFKEQLNNLTPPCTTYDVLSQKKPKKNAAPFNQSMKRETAKVTNKNPGPGSYKAPKPWRKVPCTESFGGKRHVIPAVPIHCLPWNPYTCEMCRLTPLVDFWHKNYTNVLCVQCYSEEHEEHNRYTNKQLKEFKLERDCSFMHEHNGLKPFVSIATERHIKMKRQIENYLSQYFDEFLPQPFINISIRDAAGEVNFKDTSSFYAQFEQYLMQIKKRKIEKSNEPSSDVEEVQEEVTSYDM